MSNKELPGVNPATPMASKSAIGCWPLAALLDSSYAITGVMRPRYGQAREHIVPVQAAVPKVFADLNGGELHSGQFRGPPFAWPRMLGRHQHAIITAPRL